MAQAGMTAEAIVEGTVAWRDLKGRRKIVLAWVVEWLQGTGGALADQEDESLYPQPVSQNVEPWRHPSRVAQ
jgi:hypothetical protein